MRDQFARVHIGLAWVILAAVCAQFFFAGLGVFGAAGFGMHKTTGTLLVVASLLLLIVALAARPGMVRIGLSALLLALTILQFVLARGPSLVAALHPVNAAAILGIAATLARRGTGNGVLPRPTRHGAVIGGAQ